jgi:HTH-type transcriptional regulator/antitoxin HigA
MEEKNLKQKDLVPIIGSKSKVSELLSGKINLSLKMISSIHDKLKIPLEVLIPKSA